MSNKTVYDFSIRDARGQEFPMEMYKGKVLLIVNTASACGFTPQYEGLESMRKKFHERGFEILAFPCNQFGAQEKGSDNQIQDFCQINYKLTFPVLAKIEVNGDQAHPLYEFLKSSCPGILGTEMIKWNFTKFLVGRDGKCLKRYAPQDKPSDIEKEIESFLG